MFLREKVLMRLAESCYRSDRLDEGLGHLERLEKEILPKRIYTIFLLKGKYRDIQKQFSQAAELYEKSLQVYTDDFEGERCDPSVKGNIQSRLGWALIRS